jgi:hypothetical protein
LFEVPAEEGALGSSPLLVTCKDLPFVLLGLVVVFVMFSLLVDLPLVALDLNGIVAEFR